MTYNIVSVSGTNIFGNALGEVVNVTFVPQSFYFDTPNNTQINAPVATATSNSSGVWTVSGIIDPTPDGSGIAWRLSVTDKGTGQLLYSAVVQVAYVNGSSQHWLSLTPPPAPANTAVFLAAPSAASAAGQILTASAPDSNALAWANLDDAASSAGIIPSITATKTIYVATTGNDSNSGLTWGLAKLTVGAALTALGITGSGTTQVNTPGFIQIGPGSFTDNNMHLIQSALGLEIIGAGRELTHVQGPDGLPWVSFRNSYRCRIKNLTYTGSPSHTGWGAESTSYWSGSAWYGSGLSCEQNGAENVSFGNATNSCAYGWRWRCGAGGNASNDPNSDANNDSGVLIGCYFNGCAVPISIEHSNSLLHDIRSCQFSNCGSGIEFQGGSAVITRASVGSGTTANGGSGWFLDCQPAFGTWNGASAADYQHQIDVIGTSFESNMGYIRSDPNAAGALGAVLRVRFTGGELVGQSTLTSDVGIDWENTNESVLTFINLTTGTGSSGGVSLNASGTPTPASSNVTFDNCDVQYAGFYFGGNLLLNQWRNKWNSPVFSGNAKNLTDIPYMQGPLAPFALFNNGAGGTNGVTVTAANSGGASGNAWNSAPVGAGDALTYDNTITFQGSSLNYLFNTIANEAAYVTWNLQAARELYVGMFLYYSGATTSLQTNLISFTGGLGTGTSVSMNANGTLRVATAGGSTANSVTVFTTGTGYTLASHFVFGQNSSSSSVSIYDNNGNLLETVTTTATGTTPTPTVIYFGSSGANGSTINTYWLGNISVSSYAYPLAPPVPSSAAGSFLVSSQAGTDISQWANQNTAVANLGLGYESTPPDIGAVAWTCNPANCYSINAVYATGTYAGHLMLWTFKSGAGGVVNNINYAVDAIGSVIANAFLGLYDMAGNRLAQCTTDQSTNMINAGAHAAALSAAYTLKPNTLYRVGLVIGSATAFPTLTCANVNASANYTNLGATILPSAFQSSPGSLTALPPTYGALTAIPTKPIFVMN